MKHNHKGPNQGAAQKRPALNVVALHHNNEIPADPMIGKILQERYQITAKIGEGGMGKVFEANDLEKQTKVAVKLLTQEAEGMERTVSRFANEMKALSEIRHRNVVNYFDIGIKDGQIYMVMEHAEGKNLKDFLRGKISWDITKEIILQVCDALEAAHNKKIIHRDIKPENIILMNDGTVKVLDFGLAKFRRGGEKDITEAGVIIGTYTYMAPEQFGEQYDHRVDIYAVGVMMYAMLSATYPFSGDLIAVMTDKLTKEPPGISSRVPDIPDVVEDVVMNAIKREPINRYQSIPELKDAINNADLFLRAKKDKESAVGDRNQSEIMLSQILGLEGKTIISDPQDEEIIQNSLKSTRGTSKRVLGLLAKAVTVLTLSITGYICYLHRDSLSQYFQEAKDLAINIGVLVENEQQSDDADAGSIQEEPAPTYKATIKIRPRKASVFIKEGDEERLLGETNTGMFEADVSGKCQVIIRSKGYRPKQINLTPDDPQANVRLRSLKRRRIKRVIRRNGSV